MALETHITFIARQYPPSKNINGESVWDMAKYLKEKFGVKSTVICIDKDSGGGGASRVPVGEVVRLKTLFEIDNSVFRFFNMLYDGFILANKARNLKTDLVVCTTSPPLLTFWANLLIRKKTKWAVWYFDIFPQFLGAINLVSTRSVFYKWVKKKTYQRVANFLITLGPQQASYLMRHYQKEVPYYTLPCGVFFNNIVSNEVPDWKSEDKIYLGYCGNLADAHNPDFLKAVIDNLDSAKYKLILALYGKYAEGLKDYAIDKPGVLLVESVPREQLSYIDIHLVTLREEWTHLAVPSKAVSAVSLGSNIMFCGSKESDNWHLLQKAAWFVSDDESLEANVKKTLNEITVEGVLERKKWAEEINESLKQFIYNTYDAVYQEAKPVKFEE